jgi:hypothetical protein
MLLVAARALPEKRLPRDPNGARFRNMMNTIKLFLQTLRDPNFWKPALFIYLSQVNVTFRVHEFASSLYSCNSIDSTTFSFIICACMYVKENKESRAGRLITSQTPIQREK